MSRKRNVQAWIRQMLEEEPPRSKSLLVTIFGDSVAPYSSGIWLGELIALLEPFGVNERLVRTSAFRLAEEGWLEAKRAGRRSRYSLSASGLKRVKHAYHRIYDAPSPRWNNEWTLVTLPKDNHAPPARAELRRELQWEGFGILSAGTFVHPRPDLIALNEILTRLRLNGSAIAMKARACESVLSMPASRLATFCWELEGVAARYSAFLDRFEPALPLLQRTPDPQTAFVLQTLLIHSFRRVVLHDPRLPPPLLPSDWPGHRAYELCRSVYLRTWKQTGQHLARHLEPERTPDLTPTRDFSTRLGGLDL